MPSENAGLEPSWRELPPDPNPGPHLRNSLHFRHVIKFQFIIQGFIKCRLISCVGFMGVLVEW
jgi:hypothetical protein